jgi:hypothetical protein
MPLAPAVRMPKRRPAKKYPKLPPSFTDEDNVVRQEQSKGKVRPDGPGDETAPVEQNAERT